VLIYFDVPTKMKVLDLIAPRLVPDGALVLGATETALGLTGALRGDPQHHALHRPVPPAADPEPRLALAATRR
jgi:chemotaxis protein methyltransferase CheR